MPDEHIFPAYEPGASRDSASNGDASDASRSDDSPSREHFKSLNRVQHPSDATVPGSETRTTFVSHVTDQVLTEDPPQVPSLQTPEHPFSPAPFEEVVSSDDDELGPELEVELRVQQEQLDLEFNTAHNKITQKHKEDEAAAAPRKEEREARRAAKLKKQMKEQQRQHQERMKQL